MAKKCRTKQGASESTNPKKPGKGLSKPNNGMYELYSIADVGKNPYEVKMWLNEQPVSMQVDTGAAQTVMTKHVFESMFSGATLEPTNVTLTGFAGSPIPVLGRMKVTAKYQEQEHTVSLLVVDVDSGRPNLMGRDWLKVFKLDWKSFATMNMVEKADIKKQFPEVFLKGEGPIKSFKVDVKLKEGASPCFFKPRNVPYALKNKVTEELNMYSCIHVFM